MMVKEVNLVDHLLEIKIKWVITMVKWTNSKVKDHPRERADLTNQPQTNHLLLQGKLATEGNIFFMHICQFCFLIDF